MNHQLFLEMHMNILKKSDHQTNMANIRTLFDQLAVLIPFNNHFIRLDKIIIFFDYQGEFHESYIVDPYNDFNQLLRAIKRIVDKSGLVSKMRICQYHEQTQYLTGYKL